MADKIVKRVRIEFEDDSSIECNGEEAKRWGDYNAQVAIFAAIHHQNPFDTNPIKWILKTDEENRFNEGLENLKNMGCY